MRDPQQRSWTRSNQWTQSSLCFRGGAHRGWGSHALSSGRHRSPSEARLALPLAWTPVCPAGRRPPLLANAPEDLPGADSSVSREMRGSDVRGIKLTPSPCPPAGGGPRLRRHILDVTQRSGKVTAQPHVADTDGSGNVGREGRESHDTVSVPLSEESSEQGVSQPHVPCGAEI